MKYYTFFRENNKFDDILNDINLKKVIDEKIRWSQHLVIGMQDNDKIASYITLKYGDELKNEVVKDYTPVPGVDYVPKKDASKFKKSIS